MSTFLTVFNFTIPFFCVFFAVWVGLSTMKKTGNARRALKRHIVTLFSVFTLMMVFSATASAASADFTAGETAAVTASSQIGLGLLSAAIAVGLSGIGGGIAIAGGAPAAIGATSEDSKAFGKALIFVSLGEAVALYGFVIAFVILLKLPTLSVLPALQ
jgi:V/A-type H+-transporting ATPase subunit K